MKKTTLLISVIMIIISLLIPSFSTIFTNSFSAESDYSSLKEINDKIADIKEQLNSLSKKQNSISSKLKEAKNDKNQSMKAKMLIEEQIQNLQKEREYLEEYITDLEDSIDILDEQISQTQDIYDNTYDLYRARIRANYENGTISYLEIFLTSKSFSEMLTRMDFTAYIINYDKSIMSSLSDALVSIRQDRYELEQKQNESIKALDELSENLKKQESAISDLDNQISKLKADEESLAAQQEEFNRLEEELDKEVSKLMDAQKQFTDQFLIWPLYNYSRVSSPFGWRTLYGKKDYHTGIDIPAPSGTDIHACASGTVILAGWVDTGGGLKIRIDHGGGISTIYCHCSKILVKVGDEVKQGDVIGRVGTTGNSTGNHLHLGLYVKGEYLNPADYVNYKNDPDKMKNLFD